MINTLNHDTLSFLGYHYLLGQALKFVKFLQMVSSSLPVAGGHICTFACSLLKLASPHHV